MNVKYKKLAMTQEEKSTNMPIVPIKNGTTWITIECASLTIFDYDSDEDVYRCEFSDWAFGLFAIAAVFLVLLPLVFIIQCWIKWHHKRQTRNFYASRQSSYSSLYPHDNHPYNRIDDVIEEEPGVIYHHPRKKIGKAYYPYPAYGTCDDPSLPGSAFSSYADLRDVDQMYRTPSTTLYDETAIRRNSQSDPAILSSSVPVASAMLGDTRNKLLTNGEPQNERERCNSPDNKKSEESQECLVEKENRDDRSLKSNSGIVNNDVMNSKNLSLTESLNNSNNTDRVDGSSKNSNNAYSKSKRLLLEQSLQDQILSATPPSNMITRQDFDDYLADCVMKLPEDQRNGTFLIRNSSMLSNCKVLTLYSKSLENNASLYYYKIFYNDDGTLYLESTLKTFGDIDTFINYHRKTRSILPCLLAECLGRNF